MRLTKPTGSDPLSRLLARIIEKIDGQQVVESPDIRPEYGPRGVALLLNRRNAGGGSPVEVFTITEIYTSGLMVCRKKSAPTGSDYIIQPPGSLLLQPTPWVSGSRVTRGDKQFEWTSRSRRYVFFTTYSNTSTTPFVAEEIDPSYEVGDDILAVKVTVDGDTVWYDLNIDGRKWREIPIETEVCYGGFTKYSLVYRGANYTR